jgi:hypothetical protein
VSILVLHIKAANTSKMNRDVPMSIFTINSSISERDHKCETRNAVPEIGTDGSSQPRRNPPVDGYGSQFGPPRGSESVFWIGLEPTRPVFMVQAWTAGRLPRPIGNTKLYTLSLMVGGLQ